MIAFRWCVVLLLVLLATPRAVRAQASEVCTSTVPANIQPGIFAEYVLALLHASPTFRAQCERIAAVRYVRVELSLVLSLGGVRAETTIDRFQSGALRAAIRIAFGQDYRELIAHEFEHIIEQIDGVDLHTEAAGGGAWLVDRNVFETRRASEAGARVRRECELVATHAVVVIHEPR
ncbi:MAG TPA: hypothetical protein VFZ98_12990 [Vicinamibacterales bacterium]